MRKEIKAKKKFHLEINENHLDQKMTVDETIEMRGRMRSRLEENDRTRDILLVSRKREIL